ncbi:MAG: flippase-like domain-containing protein [Acidobacteriales bacterium]|nr:flippase-like domain-containing protein [Terriglobales bacterium]
MKGAHWCPSLSEILLSGGISIKVDRRFTWIIVTAAIVAAAGFLVYGRWHESGFQWDQFAGVFSQMDWFWVLVSLLLNLATYFGRTLRWAVMIRPLQPRPSYWNLFSATVIGFTAILLFGRPGELVRPYLISAKERVSFSSQMAAWLLERIYDLLAVAFIFGLGLSQVRVTHAQLGPGMKWVLSTGGYVMAAIGAACLLALVVFRNFSEVLRARVVSVFSLLPKRIESKAVHMLDAFLDGTKATRDSAAVLSMVFYTFAEWLVIVLGFLAIFRAFSRTAGFSFMEVLILLGFVAFGGVVQIPGVGGGMQIAIIVVLTEIFRFSLEPATGIAIMFWALNFLGIVPLGLLLAFHEGLNWHNLRHIKDIENQ